MARQAFKVVCITPMEKWGEGVGGTYGPCPTLSVVQFSRASTFLSSNLFMRVLDVPPGTKCFGLTDLSTDYLGVN